MEDLDEELFKWAEAPKEIEKEVHEMLERRHSLGYTCLVMFGAILVGIVMFKIEQKLNEKYPSIFMKVYLDLWAIVSILGGIAACCSYYRDEKYLKGRGTQEKVRIKTVLLHEVIIRRYGMGRNATVKSYLKISYPMGDETVTRELSYSDLHYDIGLLGLDFIGFYGKKITIAYCNKEFYILNHVYSKYDDEDIKTEGKKELLKDAEPSVKTLAECKDEKQIMRAIMRAELQEELLNQTNYKMVKYSSRMVNIVGVVIWCLLRAVGNDGKLFAMCWGGMMVILLIFRFWEWHSCKKKSGDIWDRKKIREVLKELE